MIVALHPRMALLLAGLALLAVGLVLCEPSPAESSAAEPAAILGNGVSDEPATSGKLDDTAIAPSSTSVGNRETGPIRAAHGPAPDHPTVPDRAKPIPVSSRRVVSEKTSAATSAATLIQLYRASCLQCHDSDGRGEVVRDSLPSVPDFTDAEWHASRSDAELSRSILQGKGKSMPRMKKKLGSVDVKQMVSFVRAFQDGKQVVDDEPDEPAAPEQSTGGTENTAVRPPPLDRAPATQRDEKHRETSRLFQRYCAMCHGPDGRGTGVRETLPMIPDFTRREWQEVRSDPRLVVNILDGKGARMPSFGGKVAREQARDLVAFIRTFAPSPARPVSTAMDEFEARIRELNLEFENLQRQIRALSTPTPRTASGPP